MKGCTPTGLRFFVAAIAIASAAIVSISAEPSQQRIVVHPIEVPDSDPVLAALGVTMRGTIELAFHMLGQFSVVEPQDDHEMSGVDQHIRGHAYREEDGSFHFTLIVDDSATGDPLFTGTYVADTLFDTFQVADDATVALLEAITTQTIRFGALRIVADDPQTPLSIEIRGQQVAHGTGTVSIERIITGVHRVRVTQNRPLNHATIAEEDLTIAAGEELVFGVTVPLFTEEEQEFYRIPTSLWNDVYQSPIMGTRAVAAHSGPAHLGEPGAYIPSAVRSAIDSFTNTARTFYAHATHAAWRQGQARVLVRREITIDGDSSDWAGIPQIPMIPRTQRETIGDSVPAHWKLALSPDGGTLYLFMRTAGGPVRRQLWYRFFFTPGGAVRHTREPFQMDIQPTSSRAAAASQWSPGHGQHIEFVLPSRNAVGDGWMEARVDLRDRAFTRPFTLGAEVLRGSNPYPRFSDIRETAFIPVVEPMRRTVRSGEMEPVLRSSLGMLVKNDQSPLERYHRLVR